MSTRPPTYTPPATITQAIVSLSGAYEPDVTVVHARTTDARITLTLGGILMVFYNCAAVQGLRAAFTAAKQHSALIPEQIPTPQQHIEGNRITMSIDWTRAPNYAVVAQSGVNKLRSTTLRWIDVYTAAITWQIRDRVALNTMLDAVAALHTVAIATFLDGDEHSDDPEHPHPLAV
ncbi:hypothetical protein [Mycobacterium avium]|uniref:hypothetical protein n=1 Tax=Mycobacterium avium TaxID=1764 RepID=UPI0009FE7F4A|nr:hypothetical protein [Mycobacterium avium]